MYLPFLRGKIFEFKAIKEFIEESYGHEYGRHIMPIIEPVKKDTSALINCSKAMVHAKMPFAIILNPKLGDYQRNEFDIFSFLNEILDDNEKLFTPAFNVIPDETHINVVINTISEHKLQNVMLIFMSGVDVESDKVQQLIQGRSVAYLAVSDIGQSRTLQRKLKKYNKNIVTIEDKFKAQKSNYEYRHNLDELFTDTFNYYKQDDHFFGFSDFTTLTKEYREGGVLPPVVAIHLTYQRNPEEVFVHHFLSQSRRGRDNIRAEYKEACELIDPFFADKEKTTAISQLKQSEYPGLGAIKKYSIKNHLELMNRILHQQEDTI